MKSCIAVTGGIAEGKTTVLSYLQSLGLTVASADEIAKNVYNDAYIQDRISDLVHMPAPVPREAVLDAIQDPQVRRELNRMMHPAIWATMRASIANAIEVPLLYEACLHSAFRRVWVVTCGPDEQLRRLSDRVGEEQAQRLIAGQAATPIKSALAHVIIRTNVSEEAVMRSVTEALLGEGWLVAGSA